MWKSSEKKVVWYPDDDEFDGPSADDDELKKSLLYHEASLSQITTQTDDEISSDVEANLRQMGYL
ncbi:hypothetical protein SAMN06269185_1281 [Natronoarchaeum philippinense]|uniref:Uncharacterized protein n=1 Tax=Natronoarchaeum philippinense TaxID=558529 RepID=A0A285NBG9_NATPI|nr:hypothetical protein [Natronoarchaeum philippinense]SNZ06769.1 hypothetical protein SAMN06269185_1281 [Natronoarchaeum philippinense]